MIRTPAARWLAVPLALALTLAAACSSDSGTAAPGGTTGGTTPGAPSPTGGEITQADIDASLGQIDGIVADTMNATGVPGVAVGIVYGDEVVFTKGYGVRSTETNEPVDENTRFQIASLSKPVSGTIISGLTGTNDFAWDDEVQQANPDFELGDPWVSEHVTYADLVSMRAGLPGLGGTILESLDYDRDTIISRLRLLELNPFRDSYEYSNFSLTAGGVLAAKAAGMTWEEAADSVLFGPAGMTSTSYENAVFEASDNKAALHVDIDGQWKPEFTRMPDAQAPAGGVSSDIVDLATWGRIVLNEGALGDQQLVDEDAFIQMVSPAINNRPPSAPLWQPGTYGLGINVGTDAYGNARWNHSGAFSTGAGTTAVFLPTQKVGIIVLTNAQPMGASEAITDAYLELLETGSISKDWTAEWGKRLANIYGDPEDLGPRPDPPVPPQANSAYVGTYANEYVGEVQVIETDAGGLAIVMGPKDRTWDLTAHNADTFTYLHDPELPDFLYSVTFTMGADGTATALDLSIFDQFGWGQLQRA